MAIFCIPLNEAHRLVDILGKDAFNDSALKHINIFTGKGTALYYDHRIQTITLVGIQGQDHSSVYNLRTAEECAELIFNIQLGT